MLIVEALDQAIDPAKAQGLIKRILVCDGCPAGVAFGENEPHLCF